MRDYPLEKVRNIGTPVPFLCFTKEAMGQEVIKFN
jgi:hypothetical protein